MVAPRFAPAAVNVATRPDGSFVLSSPEPLAPYARCVGDWLERWALEAPDRTFLAERDKSGHWRRIAYAEALRWIRAIAGGLLELGGAPDRPVLLLSENSIDHALVQLAAMHVGIPAAPVSPSYSLLSRDFARLREIAASVGAGVVYAEDSDPFAGALHAIGEAVPALVSFGEGTKVSELAMHAPSEAVDRAFAAVGPETVAKILFTSGSTGSPRGVVNPQRMLCSNQQGIAQVWPLLQDRPPVVVDWLPWSHTFGGNHNFNMVLANGGTLYIDRGKPAPGLFDATVANLRDVSPTLYFNVPRGFERLVGVLETDEDLRTRFFARLELLFYAAAALPQSTWERLERVAERAQAHPAFVSAWGSTETAPLVTSVHFPIPRAGVIGLPIPGTDLKFAPELEGGGKWEMRVRGPNVTPGCWQLGGPALPVRLDDEGFLPTGDAGRLEDPQHPTRGVVFDGRIAENFKLSTGTWVSVGELRVKVVAACSPHVLDAVVAGHDRDFVTLLAIVVPGQDRTLLVDRLRVGLRAHNQANPASSSRIARVLVLDEPLSIDHGEITDKGYINQRAVLRRRSDLVERLYETTAGPTVIAVD